ncbi:MAG: dienelactone hydrolase family protein [Burkholderiales bacterium]
MSVIVTSSEGLTVGDVTVTTSDVDIPAYRAMPAAGGPFPVILVVQEIFGLHEWVMDVCRRLARAGYYAIAPSLYERQGDATKVADTQALIRDIVSKVSDAQVMRDLDATLAFAKGTGNADVAKLGITGFCWGGRIVWMYAGHNAALKAAVAWYGPVSRSYHAGDRTALDVVPDIRAAVLGLYGGDDPGIPNDTTAKIGGAMKAAGKTCEIVVYPDTPHGFLADYRPSYRKEAAEDGWNRLVEWFRKRLG